MIFTCICPRGATDSTEAFEAFDGGSIPSEGTRDGDRHLGRRQRLYRFALLSNILHADRRVFEF